MLPWPTKAPGFKCIESLKSSETPIEMEYYTANSINEDITCYLPGGAIPWPSAGSSDERVLWGILCMW